MDNVTIGIKFFVLNVIFLILAAHIERTGLFEIVFSKISRKRYSTNFIITITFLFSTLYLFPVFIEIGRKISKKADKGYTVFSLILLATIAGSIISPIGNQRNLFLHSYLSSYYPENMRFLPLFFKNTFISWITSLILLNIICFILKPSFTGMIETNKFRYKELIFFLICLFLVIPFAMGKLNFLGFAFIVIFFMIALTSMKTLKITRWIYLIPSLIVIPLSIIPSKTSLNLDGYLMHFISYLTSGLITSNFSSVIFSTPDLKGIDSLIRGVSSGALIPILGSFEFINAKYFMREKINIFIFMLFSLICLLISLIK